MGSLTNQNPDPPPINAPAELINNNKTVKRHENIPDTHHANQHITNVTHL